MTHTEPQPLPQAPPRDAPEPFADLNDGLRALQEKYAKDRRAQEPRSFAKSSRD